MPDKGVAIVAAKKRYKYTTVKQVGGDDGYCWAVFVGGRERVNGCTKREAAYYRDRFEREAADKAAATGGPK